MSAICESCGVDLLFVENVKTGKRLPLRREPLSADIDHFSSGMVVVSPSRRKGRVITKADIDDQEMRAAMRAAAEGGRLHETHFADCPARTEWQGRSRATSPSSN